MNSKSITIIIILFIAIINVDYCLAQVDSTAARKQTIITADSLASGNYKDILTSFFQLSVKNLTGANKDLHFVSNPYAVMLKRDPTLANNTKFLKPINRFWRRLNFDVDAKLDSAFHFNGFSLGITYELLNKRDASMSKAVDVLMSDNVNDREYHNLLITVKNHIRELFLDKKIDIATQAKFITDLSNATTDTTLTFDKIDLQLQTIIKQVAVDSGYTFLATALANNPHLNIYSERNKGFREIVNSFQNKPLWTLGMNDTSYSNGRLFKSVQFSTEFLKGIVHPNNVANLELDIKATTNFTDDTLRNGKDLHRLVFNFEPGINLVLKGVKNQQSYLEFKLSGNYINVWRGNLYSNEKHITNTINGTLRVRVFDEIWIPIEVKYDTRNHNVLGFLNVTTNFKAIGNVLKGKI